MQTLEKSAAPQPATAAKQPATIRIAVWSAHHKWLVVALWFSFTFGLFATGQLMGTKTRTLTNEADVYRALEASKGWQLFNADGSTPPPQTFIVVVSHPTLKTDAPEFKANVTGLTTKFRQMTYTENGQNLPLFAQIIDAYSLPIPMLNAKDGSATRLIAIVNGDPAQQSQNLKPAVEAIKTLRSENPAFQVNFLNQTLYLDELLLQINHDLDSSLIITLPATFIILLVAFGTLVAASVPLVLAMSALLGAFGVLSIYSNLIEPVDFSAGQLIALIGLAVGIDYSLFMIKRYRAERYRGRDKFAAIEVASSTAGRAVFFSGLIVMVSLSGLYLMSEASFAPTATGTVSVVAISVLGSLTFLPAALAILGKGLEWGRLPFVGNEREEGGGFWAKMVKVVMARPVVSVVVVSLLLLGLGAPALRLNLASNPVDGVPDKLEGSRAMAVLTEKWTEGTVFQVYVFATNADQPATKDALAKLEKDGLQLKGLSGPTQTVLSKGGKVAQLSFYMSGTRSDPANRELILKLRNELVPRYFANLPGTSVHVSGEAAFATDITAVFVAKAPLVVGFVLVLSFVLLMVAFHSLLIPLKAILLNFLSLAASYGVLVLIFQDGWFADALNFKPTNHIEAFLPLFMFTILFGLSMDYHLLILTRIKEARDRGMNTTDAVAKGISVTSGTITSAAAIMVVVFAVFATMSLLSVKQMGIGLAVAILIDATLIRCILLPATMRLLGEWNWWLPSFLGWLPHVTIEGETEESEQALVAKA